jgi:hypothetical protein
MWLLAVRVIFYAATLDVRQPPSTVLKTNLKDFWFSLLNAKLYEGAIIIFKGLTLPV